MKQRFTDRNMTIGGGATVHDVSAVPWLGDNQMPAPACGVGSKTVRPWDDLRPTRKAVTCKRCQRGGAGRSAPPRYVPGPTQLAFDIAC